MKLYSSYQDSALAQLLAKGDEKAFTEIYNRYWEKLFSVASNKVNDLSLAEELVQDIFLDIWKRRSTINITGELAAYLAVAMKYKVIDARQKRNRATAYAQHAGSFPLADDSTRQQLSFEELKDRLAALVGKLPEKCQLVYRLSREAGLSQKEIANHLDISEKTVESHISRAVKSIQSGLDIIIFFFL
jgi:RNA polymerase sigma-70 factor (family 1)